VTPVEVTTAGPGLPRRARLAAYAAVFLAFLDNFALLPLIAPRAQELGADALGVGLAVAAYSLTNLVLNLVGGSLTDRVGRRLILLVSLAVSPICIAIYGLADTLPVFLAARVVHGAFGGFLTASLFALLADLAPEDVRRLAASLSLPLTGDDAAEIAHRLNAFLDALAAPLAEAGIDRATVSCDSLLRHRFKEMTRRDALDKVLSGLKAAEAAGLTPIKINVVVIGGTNDDEVVDFARWSRETGYEVRFIEYMPLDAQRAWERAKVAKPQSLPAITFSRPTSPAKVMMRLAISRGCSTVVV